MPRKKVVKIVEQKVEQQQQETVIETPKNDITPATPASAPVVPPVEDPPPAPAHADNNSSSAAAQPPVEPVSPAVTPAGGGGGVVKRKRAPAAPRKNTKTQKVMSRTRAQLKREHDEDRLVAKVLNSLRRGGYTDDLASPPQPIPRVQRKEYRPPAAVARRATRPMDLQEVLQRHNVPNHYRRGRQEYVEEIEDDEEEEEPLVEESDDYEEDEIENYTEPKSKRFIPNSNNKVSTVYSQIFGGSPY